MSEGIVYTDVRTIPKNYTSDMAISKGDVVILNSNIYNKDKLNNFLNNINNNKDDHIQIVTYTQDGYPLIEQLYYVNGEITLVTDNTRHSLITNEDKEINTYKVENIIKNDKEDLTVYIANLLNGESFDIAYLKK